MDDSLEIRAARVRALFYSQEPNVVNFIELQFEIFASQNLVQGYIWYNARPDGRIVISHYDFDNQSFCDKEVTDAELVDFFDQLTGIVFDGRNPIVLCDNVL